MSEPTFEVRPAAGSVILFEVWDVTHPHDGNAFPVLRVDSKGASEDFHEEIARVCADALSKRWPRRGP